jgi:mono/diheme cytochrome c family protein
MRSFLLYVTVALSLALSSGARAADPARTLEFKNRGLKKGVLSLEEIKAHPSVRGVKVDEPHEHRTILFKAVPVRELLDKMVGPGWKKAEEVLFTCADGYQPSIPVARFLKSDAYFAFERTDQPSFVASNKDQNDALVALGPFYLIWENINDRAIRAPGSSVWPYQVVSVDLVSFADRFPGMAPAAGASEKVRNGFLQFRTYCMSCHALNGEGGKKAKDLNFPTSVTEFRDESWLYRMIDDPSSVMPGVKMAPFNRDESHRTRAIGEIIAYLRHMKGKPLKIR